MFIFTSHFWLRNSPGGHEQNKNDVIFTSRRFDLLDCKQVVRTRDTKTQTQSTRALGTSPYDPYAHSVHTTTRLRASYVHISPCDLCVPNSRVHLCIPNSTVRLLCILRKDGHDIGRNNTTHAAVRFAYTRRTTPPHVLIQRHTRPQPSASSTFLCAP